MGPISQPLRACRGAQPKLYPEPVIIEFEGEVYRWKAREDSWYFLALPPEPSADIRDVPRPQRGFGSVRVQVRIGGSRWRTSIFPDAGQGVYVLPLKKAVRTAEDIEDGDTVTVQLEVADV